MAAAGWYAWPHAHSAVPAKPGSSSRTGDVGAAGTAVATVFRDGKWQAGASRSVHAFVARPAGTVRITGVVRQAHGGSPVGDVEVVFADGAGESSTTADADGSYFIDVAPDAYRVFTRGDHVLTVGRAGPSRLPSSPDETAIGMASTELAPLVDAHANHDGIDVMVIRGGTITGRVLTAKGQPIAGAIVRAQGGELRPVLGTDVAESDASGNYHLEIPVGTYTLDATHARFAGIDPTTVPMVTVATAVPSSMDLTMSSGCIVTGRVVNARGEAAGEGAIERRVGEGEDAFNPTGKIEASGNFRWTTTDEGDISLRGWPWKSPHSTEQRFACRDGARFANVVFTLPNRAPDLEGTIATADGKPAPFAYIEVHANFSGGGNQQERADAAGHWSVYSLPHGSYNVTAYHADLGTVEEVSDAPKRDVALTFSGTGALVGTVKGATSGSFPIDLAGCVGHNRDPQRRMAIVEAGHYRLDGVPACAMVFRVPGAREQLNDAADIVAGQDHTFDVDLRAREAKNVHGVVRDEAGKPVAGAMVASSHAGTFIHDDGLSENDGVNAGEPMGGGTTTVTASDGSYQLRVIGGSTINVSSGGGENDRNEFVFGLAQVDDDDIESPQVDVVAIRRTLDRGSDTLIENFADNGGITDDDEADEADRGDGDGDGRELPDTATVGEAGDAPARD